MGNFGRGGGRGGFGQRRSFDRGGRGGFDRGDRGDRQMFSVVCSNCGKDAQVPFRPTGDKPVYCSDCFEKMGGKSERRSFGGPRRDGGSDNLKPQLEALNVKLDKIISLLTPQPAKTEEVLVEETVVKPPKAKKSSKKASV